MRGGYARADRPCTLYVQCSGTASSRHPRSAASADQNGFHGSLGDAAPTNAFATALPVSSAVSVAVAL